MKKSGLSIVVSVLVSFAILFSSSCKKDEESFNCDHIQNGLDSGMSIKELLESCSVENLYGKTYQGGLIFYYNESTGKGYVVTEVDVGMATWYNEDYSLTGVTDTLIGTGKANTLAIIDSQGEGIYAAGMCDSLVLNGYSDWFLPSLDEMKQIYYNLHENGYGNFEIDNLSYYWTSSEYEEPPFDDIGKFLAYACIVKFGYFIEDAKEYEDHVRAIREFN